MQRVTDQIDSQARSFVESTSGKPTGDKSSFGRSKTNLLLSAALAGLLVSVFPFIALAQQEVVQEVEQSTFSEESAQATTDTLKASPDGTAVEAVSTFTSLLNPYDYESRGRPDPFAKPTGDTPVSQGALHGVLTPLQRYELSELRLVGVLWNVNNPKAMLRDPAGGTHIVMPFAKIGPRNGYIASIREGEIVVVETIEFEGRPVSTAQVVKIAR